MLQEKTQEIRHKADYNRRTLRKLHHKLDKIHDCLAQAKQRHQSTDSRPAHRPLLRRQIPLTSRTGYELATIPAKVTFRITNPYYIQWQPNEQSIVIRAPRRFDTMSRWHNKRGNPINDIIMSTH